MGLFDKIKGPVFIKESGAMEEQLVALIEAKKTATQETAKKIEREIQNISAGNFGENSIIFELKNSHLPLLILHDLCLEHNGLTGQIDFLIITRRHIYVVECKNLYGNIEIDNKGNFMRVVRINGRYSKEGIYSPITQNQRHLELIKQVRAEEKSNVFTKALFEKGFSGTYIPIVVLANAKTVLNAKYAPKEVKEKVIRADQIIRYISDFDAASKSAPMSEKDMERLAQFFLDKHKVNFTDYTEKYSDKLEKTSTGENAPAAIIAANRVLCPKCGALMIKRTAGKGPNAGKSFYGCSNFPKCRGVVNIG